VATQNFSYDLGEYQGKRVSDGGRNKDASMLPGSMVEVRGIRELRKAFRDAEEGMEDLKGLHKYLADDVADTAKTKVPVRTGRLQRSIRGSGTKTAARVRAGNNRASGATAVPYGPAIHFGWSRRGIKPQPFLYEALDDRRQEVIDAYNDEVRSLIRRVF
tara:strand:- start:728 stop:1207 length:480 start_codon:yes stop_codon:yes gene_type:complete